LKGRYSWHRWNPDALRRAAGYFQQAIERDASCAAPYSGLADSYFLQGFWGNGTPRQQGDVQTDGVHQRGRDPLALLEPLVNEPLSESRRGTVQFLQRHGPVFAIKGDLTWVL